MFGSVQSFSHHRDEGNNSKQKVKSRFLVLDIFSDHLFHARLAGGLARMGVGSARHRIPTRFPTRTPQYRMGKDGIDLLMTIKNRLNFWTQRDSKVQDRIDRNGLGNRWRSPVLVCHRAPGQVFET